MLLLPSFKSGQLREGNVGVLKSRIERLDDPIIYEAYSSDPIRLASIGQVQIAALRLFPMLDPSKADAQSVKQSSEAGIANALLAISNAHLKQYAKALATSVGFVEKPDSYVMAGVRRDSMEAAETIRFRAGGDPDVG
jgi:hypothetical protein